MPNIWPTSDTFDDGSPILKDRGYFSVVPDNGTAYQYGTLHDGHEIGGGFAAAMRDNANGNDGNSIGFVRKETHPEDVVVRAVLAKRQIAGAPPDADAVQRQGVIARMTAAAVGPLDDTGAPRFSWMEQITAYSFEVRNAGSGDLKLGLYRWDAGVEQVLIESPSFPAASAGWNLRGLLQLQVTTTGGGDALLAASVGLVPGSEAGELFQSFSEPGGTGGVTDTTSGPPSSGATLLTGPTSTGYDPRVGGLTGRAKKGGPAPPPVPPDDSTPVEVLAYTDSSVNKIVAPGRCGFIVDDERDTAGSGGGTWISGCEAFEVIDQPSSTTLWLDAFERSERGLSAQWADAFGVAGRDLTSDWSADQGSILQAQALTSGGVGEVRLLGQNNLGNACDMDGTTPSTNVLFLNPAGGAFSSLPPGETVLELSIVLWARMGTNRNGNVLYNAPDAAPIGDGFIFRWIDAGSGNMRLQVVLYDDSGADYTAETGNLTASTYLGSTWCYGFTYKANHFNDGTGRLRIYLGRLANASLLQEFVVPANCQPTFPLVEHRIGDLATGSGSARYMDGAVDRLSIFYDELDGTSMDLLADEQCTDGQITALGAVHSTDFENSTTDATYRNFPVWLPDGATTDWRAGVGDVTLITGLVTTLEDSFRHMIHQRPSEDLNDQARSLLVEITEGIGRVGIVLLGGGISHKGVSQMFIDAGTYYRIVVGVGSPAPCWVDRVVNGVATLIGRENAGTSTANVAEDTPFTLIASARRSNPDDPNSATIIAATVDGTLIPMRVAGSGDPGVAVSVDDHLIDGSLQRIVSGASTGLVATSPTATATDIDTWALASLIGGSGGGVSPDTLASVSLPFEADNVSGNLNTVLVLEWDVVLTYPRNVRRTGMVDGRIQQQGRTGFQRRRARLTSRGIPTEAELEALRVFFEDRGREIPFTWNELGDSKAVLGEPAGIWRFRSASWSDAIARNGAGRVSFEIEECNVRPAGLIL